MRGSRVVGRQTEGRTERPVTIAQYNVVRHALKTGENFTGNRSKLQKARFTGLQYFEFSLVASALEKRVVDAKILLPTAKSSSEAMPY